MSLLATFPEITQADQSLGSLTWMKVGGLAQFIVEPRSFDETQAVVAHCHEHEIPIHVLGSGSNVLIRDEGLSGVVLRLTAPAFSQITIDGLLVKAGAGVVLSHLITETVKAGLAGLETLVGIPGTVGGALRGNSGGRSGDIGQNVASVSVLTGQGERFTRREDELAFEYRSSSITDLVIFEAEFKLYRDSEAEIVRRMRKLWIMKKASQPLASQSAGCVFKNPRGMSAGALIDQAGMKGTRIGGAEISDRHANFIVTHEGATSGDVLRLIDLARSKVAEQFGVDLELEVQVW